MMLQCIKTNRLHTVIGVVLLLVLINWYTITLLNYNPKPLRDATEIISRTSRSSRAVKYILQWTRPDTRPFVFWGKGQEEFLKRKCKETECFVTNNKALLRKITDYDAIAFDGPEITRYKPGPREWSERQKYVYVSIESSHYYPICDKRYDDYFNWTWTYRLDSDLPYAYIAIRDADGNVIGPHETLYWIDVDSMEPISIELKERLSSKKKAAAWFVSNCKSKGKGENYVKKLQQELEKYHLKIDVFGKCGPKSCSLSKKVDCLKMIEEDYYFYMSMENSFSDDYVTEKLLTALQNFAVPVVYGAANYTRLFCVKRCARCGNGITANELVMRARDTVFHLTCFTCAACGTLLSKGDVFGMRDGLVYCRPHYDACLDYCDEEASVYRCQEMHSEGDSPQYYGGPSQKGRPRKRKLAQAPDDMQVQTMRMASSALELLHRGDLSSSMESLAYDSSVASPGSVSSHTQRTKRMRTSFKHHQLRTMKSYFAINQNPDAKDLKQLAQKTGLSKRVLQVWFQNARAKWRRNIMRQESNGNPGHPGIQGPAPSVLMTESLQTLEDLRVHTPHHPMTFSEMY